MIAHVVTFTWKPEVGRTDVAALVDLLRRLPARIDALLEYRFGSDLGLTEGTGDFAIVATVADTDALRAYLDHPAHAEVAARLRAMAQVRLAVQIQA